MENIGIGLGADQYFNMRMRVGYPLNNLVQFQGKTDCTLCATVVGLMVYARSQCIGKHVFLAKGTKDTFFNRVKCFFSN